MTSGEDYWARPDRRLGVVGGLGPRSIVRFHALLCESYRTRSGANPDMLLHSVPADPKFGHALVTGSFGLSEERVFGQMLNEACGSLRAGGADFIAIASNTLNCLFAVDGSAPISIVGATCQRVQQFGARRVGLLASTATVSSRAYEVELGAAGIEVVTPTARGQEVIDEVINASIGSPRPVSSASALLPVLVDLSDEVDAVVLGSVHLSEIFDDTELVGKPVIDSAQSLADACCHVLLAREPIWLVQQRLSAGRPGSGRGLRGALRRNLGAMDAPVLAGSAS